MSLEGRLKRLEAGPAPARCPECGAVPGDPTGFVAHSEDGELWRGYPEPLSCGGCGRVLRFTLKLGDARPGEVGT